MSTMNMEAANILVTAKMQTRKFGQVQVLPESILLSILMNPSTIAYKALSRLIDIDKARPRVEKSLTLTNPIPGQVNNDPTDSQLTTDIINKANSIAAADGSTSVGSEHILQAIAEIPNTAAFIFLSFWGISQKNILDSIAEVKKIKATTSSTTQSLPSAVAATVSTVSAVASAIADGIKTATTPKPSKKITRDDWIKVLDQAIALAEKNEISVPSAFTEVCMTTRGVADRISFSHARRETLQEVIQGLLDMDGLSK